MGEVIDFYQSIRDIRYNDDVLPFFKKYCDDLYHYKYNDKSIFYFEEQNSSLFVFLSYYPPNQIISLPTPNMSLDGIRYKVRTSKGEWVIEDDEVIEIKNKEIAKKYIHSFKKGDHNIRTLKETIQNVSDSEKLKRG